MDFKPFRDAIESQYNSLQLTGYLYTVQNDFTVKVNNRQYLIKIKD